MGSPEPPRVSARAGPLDAAGLNRVAALYGRADPKYRSLEFLRHLLVDGPAGAALHAFAHAGDEAVGHCCVVPLPARREGRPLVSGKVEALAIEEPHREASVEGRPLAVALLDRLYALADERGIDVLHAYATPELGVLHRLLGFKRVEVGAPSLVAALPGRALARRHGRRALALGIAQAVLRAPLTRRARVRPLAAADRDLVATPQPAGGAWTVAGDELWDWYRGSELLRIVELEGRFRALVQTGAPGDAVRLLAWSAQRPGLGTGLLAVAACAGFARRAGAATLRFQPWFGPRGDGGLAGAARLAGLTRVHDLTTLYVRSRSPELTAPVALTPFFHATF